MVQSKHFTVEEAKRIGETLGINWNKFDVEQFRMGLDVELEHGKRDPNTNVTQDDEVLTGKIALAHLNEFPDYYIRLQKMESERRICIKLKNQRKCVLQIPYQEHYVADS
ncbi:MAG TPA: DUF5661 family protein [Candidatus Eisenbacteria bacterium]|nr:DUF5661 family protein [Candidatus Eisenbacteria bacterium]